MEPKKRTFLDESGEADGASTSKIQRLNTQDYNRCIKPFDNTEKCSAKNLRKVSVNKVDIFNAKFSIIPPLTSSDRVCYKCRMKIGELCKTPESSESKFFQFT